MKMGFNIALQQASAALLLVAASFSVQAAEIIVTPGNASWAADGSSGSSTITATMPRSGNGSVEMRGDRTRFFGLGNPFDQNSDLGRLSDLSKLVFDWAIAADSSTSFDPDYTPALRVHIWDNGVRSELIWEGAYNGTYGNTIRDTWYTSGANDVFWRFQNTGAGAGPTYQPGGTTYVFNTIDGWGDSGYYSANAKIAAFSIGVGSGASNLYHAFADNVTVGLTDGSSTTYNFEVRAAAVPEPASLALVGLGLLGAAAGRRKRKPS